MDHFKQRHELRFRAISGEQGEVSNDTTSNWLKDVLPKLIEAYQPTDIYNADETGVFYQLMPNKTLTRKEDDCAGMKKSKQRVTLLLGANMDGSDRLHPRLISKFVNPKVSEKCAFFACHLQTQQESVDDQPDLVGVAQQKRRVILFAENCPAHPAVPGLKAVTVHFLPPQQDCCAAANGSRCYPVLQIMVQETASWEDGQ